VVGSPGLYVEVEVEVVVVVVVVVGWWWWWRRCLACMKYSTPYIHNNTSTSSTQLHFPTKSCHSGRAPRKTQHGVGVVAAVVVVRTIHTYIQYHILYTRHRSNYYYNHYNYLFAKLYCS